MKGKILCAGVAAMLAIFSVATGARSGETKALRTDKDSRYQVLGKVSIPNQINYQGYLTDYSGNAVTDTVDMTFRIYNASSGDTELWNETHPSVVVTDGLFSVILGSVIPIPSGIFSGPSRWLQTEIHGQVLSPRSEIVSVAHAFRAEHADTADYAIRADTAGYAHEADKLGGHDASYFATSGASYTKTESDARYVNDNAGEVGTSDLQNNAVTSAKIQDGTIQEADLSFDVPDGHSLDASDGSPTNAVYVGNTGNVGIGTTGPTEKLDVNGDIKLRGADIRDAGGTARITMTDNGRLDLREDGGATSLSIATNGNVGIGTTAPARNLHISGPYSYLRFDNTYGNDNYVIGSDAMAGFIIWSETDNAYRMVMDNYGHIGIGTTDIEDLINWRLTVKDDIYSHGGIYSTGTNTAILGECTSESSEGIGVLGTSEYGKGVRGASQYGHGVHGYSVNGIGVYGKGHTFDVYADQGGYGPFTGAHEVKLTDDFPINMKPGMIVSITGENKFRIDDEDNLSFSSTLPTVHLSDVPNDNKVFGVFVLESPLHENHWYNHLMKDGDRFGVVNALGEGRVWVTNINGDIEAGDYITTSAIAGYGQKQDDDLLHSYTLGKVTEDVDWSKVTETTRFNGHTYKAYPISVVYTSG